MPKNYISINSKKRAKYSHRYNPSELTFIIRLLAIVINGNQFLDGSPI